MGKICVQSVAAGWENLRAPVHSFATFPQLVVCPHYYSRIFPRPDRWLYAPPSTAKNCILQEKPA